MLQVLKTMVGSNLTDKQLQEIVDKTILYADKDNDGKISYEEFCEVSIISSLPPSSPHSLLPSVTLSSSSSGGGRFRCDIKNGYRIKINQ